jgi:hypothetical protein
MDEDDGRNQHRHRHPQRTEDMSAINQRRRLKVLVLVHGVEGGKTLAKTS